MRVLDTWEGEASFMEDECKCFVNYSASGILADQRSLL